MRYSIVNHDIHNASIINSGNGSRHSLSLSWCSAAKSRAADCAAIRTASTSAFAATWSIVTSASVIFGAQPIPKVNFQSNYLTWKISFSIPSIVLMVNVNEERRMKAMLTNAII